jgi:hypothetical protein
MVRMSQKRRMRRGSIIAQYVVLALLVIGAASGGIYFLRHKRSSASQNALASVTQPTPPPKAPPYTSISGSYLLSGTVMLGRAVERAANGDYNQPFSGMSTLGEYDAHIGVLECPITSATVSYQTQVDSLKFNCSPNWLPTLKKNFPIINVSSNHLYDMGMDGFNETVKRLKDAGFQVVGNYNPHIEPDNCKVVLLPVHLLKIDNTKEDSSLPVALCSFNYKSLFHPEPGELESIQKWSKILPTIGLMNGGPEYEHTAGVDQTNVAHTMIDYGADFVVGNGTHWVQNTEVYKGKLIEYSMGNFIFDQLDYDGRIALNLSVKMNIPYDETAAAWLKVGQACVSDMTQCNDSVTKQTATKLMPTFDFGLVGSYGGAQKVATRADAQQQKDIEQRANWAATLTSLAQKP